MKSHTTLKSFEELSAETLMLAAVLPPPAHSDEPVRPSAASSRGRLPVERGEAEEFGQFPLPPNAADGSDFWSRGGLNE
jgi:hypothetical protein